MHRRRRFENLGVVERHAVVSRALASVGYDEASAELEVEFRSGRVYSYSNVPVSVYEWLLRAPNKGLFVTRQIRGHYPERALPDAPSTEVEHSSEGSEERSLEQQLRDSLNGRDT